MHRRYSLLSCQAKPDYWQGSACSGSACRTAPVSVPEGRLWPGRRGGGWNVRGDACRTHGLLTRSGTCQRRGTRDLSGGGYGGLVSDAEGHRIAEWLNQHGITGMCWSIGCRRGDDLCRCWTPNAHPHRSGPCRRVASRSPTHWHHRLLGRWASGLDGGTHFQRRSERRRSDPARELPTRLMILIYPVITMTELTHGGSRNNLLGTDPAPEVVDRFPTRSRSPQKPRLHSWPMRRTTSGHAQHSRMFYQALRAHQVPAEYLELPSGDHGLDGYQGPMWDAWQTRSIAWLAEQKFIP